MFTHKVTMKRPSTSVEFESTYLLNEFNKSKSVRTISPGFIEENEKLSQDELTLERWHTWQSENDWTNFRTAHKEFLPFVESRKNYCSDNNIIIIFSDTIS